MNGLEFFQFETFKAIVALVKDNALYNQALILIYSSIDTFAWSSKTEGDVTRKDFYDWVSKYMEPEKYLGCTKEDLYAARCGLLHANTAISRMSKKGVASQLYYGTSPHSVAEIEKMAFVRNENAKVINFSDLLECFMMAAEKYIGEVSKDEYLRKAVNHRIELWIRFQNLQLNNNEN